MLYFLDIFLTVLHVVVIVFNLLGWIWRRTRATHLVLLSLTVASWVLLGMRYGWGYCFLTDWHWRIKLRLGETELPASFIKYGVDCLTGLDFDAGLVDGVTVAAFAVVVIVTVYVNFLRRRSG